MRLRDVLQNRDLAGFGDSLVNFLYSLAATKRSGKPVGFKIGNKVLADAVRRAELRKFLPKRLDEKIMGDYAEALIAYTWLNGFLTTQKCMEVLMEKVENPVDAFARLLRVALEALRSCDTDC